MTTLDSPELDQLGRYKFGWSDSDVAGAAAKRGLNDDVVRDISAKKNEPEWMLERRLKALRIFEKKPMPLWGADLSGIDVDNIKYFVRSAEKEVERADDLTADITGDGIAQEQLEESNHLLALTVVAERVGKEALPARGGRLLGAHGRGPGVDVLVRVRSLQTAGSQIDNAVGRAQGIGVGVQKGGVQHHARG